MVACIAVRARALPSEHKYRDDRELDRNQELPEVGNRTFVRLSRFQGVRRKLQCDL